MFTLNCRGKLHHFTQPVVMGIINATPDSFYEGHLTASNDKLLQMAQQMVADGAGVIDVGGQSTRPGSQRISADEEIKRVVPVIELLHRHLPNTIISVDTYSSIVANAAVAAGASIINDVSGGAMDADMLQTAASLHTPYICMHMQGTPETMQQQPQYDDVITTILDYFIQQTANCKSAGINDVIIDPGFGFGKTSTQNFSLLKNLQAFTITRCPVLIGVSRKSTIYKTLQTDAAHALNGTTVLNTLALQNGAAILRVHDVKEACEAVTLFMAYKNAP
jgi:dihydropteroate synthase